MPHRTRLEAQRQHYALTKIRVAVTLQEQDIANLAQACTYLALHAPLATEEHKVFIRLATNIVGWLDPLDPYRQLVHTQCELADAMSRRPTRQQWPADGATNVSEDDHIELID